jgi:hypothetical protein
VLVLVRAVGDYGRMDPKMRKHSLQIDRTVFQLRPGGGLSWKWDLLWNVWRFPVSRLLRFVVVVVAVVPRIRIEINPRQDRTGWDSTGQNRCQVC